MELMKLPKINELYSDEKLEVRKSANDLNLLLNQLPKKDWIKEHPHTKIKYIPIQRIEWLLTNIFINWHVEVKDYKLIGNSVTVHIRLYYTDPITNDKKWQDGLGAAPLQTDKDAGAIDFNKLKSNAVMLALPAAESFAIKDAADKLGKLFGKDINRYDEIMYNNLAEKFTDSMDKIKEDIGKIDALDDLFTYHASLPAKMQKDSYINSLMEDRKNEIESIQ